MNPLIVHLHGRRVGVLEDDGSLVRDEVVEAEGFREELAHEATGGVGGGVGGPWWKMSKNRLNG
jgi:hypothetical protein